MCNNFVERMNLDKLSYKKKEKLIMDINVEPVFDMVEEEIRIDERIVIPQIITDKALTDFIKSEDAKISEYLGVILPGSDSKKDSLVLGKYDIEEYQKDFMDFFYHYELIKKSGDIYYIPKGKEIDVCAIIDKGDIPNEVVLLNLKLILDSVCYHKISIGLSKV